MLRAVLAARACRNKSLMELLSTSSYEFCALVLQIQAGQCGNQIGAKFWEVSDRSTAGGAAAATHHISLIKSLQLFCSAEHR